MREGEGAVRQEEGLPALPMDRCLAVAKALSDRTRLRIVCALQGGELCVAQIVRAVGVSYAGVSRHLKGLERAGVAQVRRKGRWRYWRLPPRPASTLAARILREMWKDLREDRSVAEDAARLEAIRKADLNVVARGAARRG